MGNVENAAQVLAFLLHPSELCKTWWSLEELRMALCPPALPTNTHIPGGSALILGVTQLPVGAVWSWAVLWGGGQRAPGGHGGAQAVPAAVAAVELCACIHRPQTEQAKAFALVPPHWCFF